jgi:hypothetical protein
MAGQTSTLNPLNSLIKEFDSLSLNSFLDEIRSQWKKNRPDENCSLYVDAHVRFVIKDGAGKEQHSKAMLISTKIS